jgi:hypothetical protein
VAVEDESTEAAATEVEAAEVTEVEPAVEAADADADAESK